MVLNTLQNLGPWAKSKKKNFVDLPLDVGQMLRFSLNCATGGKFQSVLAKRAKNNREIYPKMSKRARVFQVYFQTRQQFLVLAYVLRCKWLPERARWSILPASETTHRIPQEEFARKPYNKSFIDQVCSVKMAGYCPRSLFASLWNSIPSRSINTQKRTWPITSYHVLVLYLRVYGTRLNRRLISIDIECIDWFPISISVYWLRMEYFLFEQKIELLYFKPIQLQKLASELSIGNRRISSNGRAPAQHARKRMTRQKHLCNLLQKQL